MTIKIISLVLTIALVCQGAAFADFSLAKESSLKDPLFWETWQRIIEAKVRKGILGSKAAARGACRFSDLRKLFDVEKFDELISRLEKLTKEELDSIAIEAISEIIITAVRRYRLSDRKEFIEKLIGSSMMHKGDTEKNFDEIMEYYREVIATCFWKTKAKTKAKAEDLIYLMNEQFGRFLDIMVFYRIYKLRLCYLRNPSLDKEGANELLRLYAEFNKKDLHMAGDAALFLRKRIKKTDRRYYRVIEILNKEFVVPYYSIYQATEQIKHKGREFAINYLSFGEPKTDREFKIRYRGMRMAQLLEMAKRRDKFPDVEPMTRKTIVTGEEAVNIGFMSDIIGCRYVPIEEAGKCNDVNVIVIENPYWIIFRKGPRGKMPFAKRGYVVRNGRFTFAEFKTSIPLHYVVDIDGRWDWRFVKCGTPTAGSDAMEKVTGDKDLTMQALRRCGITPKNITFKHKRKKDVKKIKALLDAFIAGGGIKGEIVIKPHNGYQGRDVKFFKADDIEGASRHTFAIMSKGEDAVVQERIYSPLFMQNGKPQDWNLRVFVSRDTNDRFVVSDMVVRYDDDGVGPVNISKTAKVSVLEDIFEKLGKNGVDITLEELKRRIEETALKAAEAVEKRVRLEAGKKGERKSVHSDFMGVDVIVSREGFKPYIMEVNGKDSAGMGDLNNYLISRYGAGNERINRSVSEYVKTMIRRAREFKKTSENSNRSCGTICEKGHEGSYNALDEQLARQFEGMKKIVDCGLGIAGEGDLTEDEADKALVEYAKGFGIEVTVEQLREYRRQIREAEEGLRSMEIFFSVPETGTDLFWVKDSGTGEWTYAGGHFNKAGTRIHISLPIILKRGIRDGVEIARHEMNHIQGKGHIEDIAVKTMRLIAAWEYADVIWKYGILPEIESEMGGKVPADMAREFFGKIFSDKQNAEDIYEMWKERGGNENYLRGIALAEKFGLAEQFREKNGDRKFTEEELSQEFDTIMMEIYCMERFLITMNQYGFKEEDNYEILLFAHSKDALMKMRDRCKVIDLVHSPLFNGPPGDGKVFELLDELVEKFRIIYEHLDEDGVFSFSFSHALYNYYPFIKAFELCGFGYRIENYGFNMVNNMLCPCSELGKRPNNCEEWEYVFTARKKDLNRFIKILENLTWVYKIYGKDAASIFMWLNIGIPFSKWRFIGIEILADDELLKKACAMLDKLYISNPSVWKRIAETALSSLPERCQDILPVSEWKTALMLRQYDFLLGRSRQVENLLAASPAYDELMRIAEDRSVDYEIRGEAFVILAGLAHYSLELRSCIWKVLKRISEREGEFLSIFKLLQHFEKKSGRKTDNFNEIYQSSFRYITGNPTGNVVVRGWTGTILDRVSCLDRGPDLGGGDIHDDYSEEGRKRLFEGLRLFGGGKLPITTVNLFLTMKCPLECRHCYRGHGKNRVRNMDDSLWDGLLEEILDSRDVNRLGFNGGEPFTRLPQVLKGLEKLRGRGINIQIFTSGIWAVSIEKTEKVLEKIANAYDGDIEMQVSLNDFVFEQEWADKTPKVPVTNLVNIIKVVCGRYPERIKLRFATFGLFIKRDEKAFGSLVKALEEEGILISCTDSKSSKNGKTISIRAESGAVVEIQVICDMLNFIGSAESLDRDLYSQNKWIRDPQDPSLISIAPWGEVSITFEFGALPLGNIFTPKPRSPAFQGGVSGFTGGKRLKEIIDNARRDPLVYFLTDKFYGANYLVRLAELLEQGIRTKIKDEYGEEMIFTKLIEDPVLRYYLTKFAMRVMLVDLGIAENEAEPAFAEICRESDEEFLLDLRQAYQKAKNNRKMRQRFIAERYVGAVRESRQKIVLAFDTDIGGFRQGELLREVRDVSGLLGDIEFVYAKGAELKEMLRGKKGEIIVVTRRKKEEFDGSYHVLRVDDGNLEGLKRYVPVLELLTFALNWYRGEDIRELYKEITGKELKDKGEIVIVLPKAEMVPGEYYEDAVDVLRSA